MNKVFNAGLLVGIFLTVTGVLHGHAQQNHFVYIQSDDKQPFSAAINDKTFNSSAIGYVIIPKLIDGKYQLTVSFPNKKFPDQQFNFEVNKTDIGFALKNYGPKGWGLFNFQSLDLTMANGQAKEKAGTNDFGNMLADAVNDTSLTTPPPAKEEVKQSTFLKDTVSKAVSPNQAQVVIVPKTDVKAAEIIPVAVPVTGSVNKGSQTAPANSDTVQKIGEQVTESGTNMIFVDKGAGGKDTVAIFVPSSNAADTKSTDTVLNAIVADSVFVKKDTVKPVSTKPEAINITDTATAGTQINNPFFTNTATPPAVATTNVAPVAVIADKKIDQSPWVAENGTAVVAKQECKTMLADADFDKLRKKLFATTGDDKMIQAAQKYLQDKCITTAQVKTLSGNFLSDESRFYFFSAVYPHVADPSAFVSLQNQLIDPAYKARFKAMLK